MQTQVLQARDINRNSGAIRRAAEIIRGGGFVAFPTETVYGLGANALDETAVRGIFRAKGRPADNPLIIHITSLDDINRLCRSFPPPAKQLAEAFWPGPLTLILPKTGGVPSATSGGLDTVAVRMPSHPVARALISMAGVPIAAPSANISGSPSPTKAEHCIADLSGKVDIILDGGGCELGLESTVLSLTGDIPRLLRPGAVTPEMIRETVGEINIDEAVTGQIAESRAPSAPGMKYRHYAPKAELTIVHGGHEAFYSFAGAHTGDWFLAFDEDIPHIPQMVSCGGKDNPEAQARRLFSALRELDGHNAVIVYARAPSSAGLGLAVYNRLLRAAGFREIYL